RHRKADRGVTEGGQAEIAIAKYGQRNERLMPVDRLPAEKAGAADQTGSEHAPDPPFPMVRLPFLEAEHDEEDADRRQRNAEQIEAVLESGKVWHQQGRPDKADHAEWQIEEEDPLPTELIDQNAAGQRAHQCR